MLYFIVEKLLYSKNVRLALEPRISLDRDHCSDKCAIAIDQYIMFFVPKSNGFTAETVVAGSTLHWDKNLSAKGRNNSLISPGDFILFQNKL